MALGSVLVNLLSFPRIWHLDYPGRMDWIEERFGALFDGFDVSFWPARMRETSVRELDGMARRMERKTHNVLHFSAEEGEAYGHDREATDLMLETIEWFASRSLAASANVHACDVDDKGLREESRLPMLVEVMGDLRPRGNTMAEMEEFVFGHGWGLTLDTAHVQEMRAHGQPGVGEYLQRFGERVEHAHVSCAANPYREQRGFEEVHTLHALMVLVPECRMELAEHLPELATRPVSVEGFVPGEDFEADFIEEMKLVRSYWKNESKEARG